MGSAKNYSLDMNTPIRYFLVLGRLRWISEQFLIEQTAV